MFSLDVRLKKGEPISPVLFDDTKLSEFIPNESRPNEIQSISIEISTQISPTISYGFK